jgi:hypothetical protein
MDSHVTKSSHIGDTFTIAGDISFFWIYCRKIRWLDNPIFAARADLLLRGIYEKKYYLSAGIGIIPFWLQSGRHFRI